MWETQGSLEHACTIHSGYKYIIIAKTQCSGRTWCDISPNSLVESWPLTGNVFVLQPISFFTSVFIIIKNNVMKFCVYQGLV